jgi:hypothetical protein
LQEYQSDDSKGLGGNLIVAGVVEILVAVSIAGVAVTPNCLVFLMVIAGTLVAGTIWQ